MTAVPTLPPDSLKSPQAVITWAKSGWDRLMDDLPLILGRIAVASVLIVAGFLLLRLGRRIIRKWNQRTARKKETVIPLRQTRTLQSLLLSVFNYAMYFIIAASALSALGVDVRSILALAGVGGVAIGFGCQTLVKDVVSGLFLWTDGNISVGDMVTVAGQTGTVESISLRNTVLRSVNGCLYAVPNGDIRTVVNMTAKARMAQVDVMVNHGRDLKKAIACIQDEMEKLKEKLDQPQAPQVLGVIGADRFAATVRIECPCKAEEVWALEREIRLAALNRLTQEELLP